MVSIMMSNKQRRLVSYEQQHCLGGRTIQDSSNNGAKDLHRKGDAGRKFDVLAKLQVPQHQDALRLRVLAVQRAIHVRDRVPRDKVRRDHLVEAVRRRIELAEPDRRSERREEHRHQERDEEDDRERPPRQARVRAVICRLRDRVRGGKEDEVPPARDLLVHLHLLVVGVVNDERRLVPRVEGLEERLDVLPMPEEDVRERRPEREVRGYEVQRVRGREPCGLDSDVTDGVSVNSDYYLLQEPRT